MKLKYILFVFVETILFTLVIYLGYKIYKIKRNVLGTQVVKINKDYMQFATQSSQLKYFYEPKENSVQKWNGDWLGYEVDNQINSDSLNEVIEYKTEKNPHTFRIITIGDSFTYGMYVRTESNFSKVLERSLNSNTKCDNISNFEVINLGVPGYDAEYTVERFIKRGIKYKPDLIIWLLNYWNISQILEFLTPEINKFASEGLPQTEFKYNQIYYPRMQQAWDEFLKKHDNAFIFSYYKNILNKLKNNYNSSLLLITDEPDVGKFGKFPEYFISLSPNYKYFNLSTAYSKDDSMHFNFDNHLNEKGHKVIANNILKYLSTNYLSNCH